MSVSEHFVTMVGVIFLAAGYVLNMVYINQQETGRLFVDEILPFGLNIAVTLMLCVGIIARDTYSSRFKFLIVMMLLMTATTEMYFMMSKPSSWYGVSGGYIVTTLGAMLKLYLILSLHCDVTSKFSKSVINGLYTKFIKKTKKEPQREAPRERETPRERERERDPRQEEYARLSNELSTELRRDTTKTPEQKLAEWNAFRESWGKSAETLEERKFGGKRLK
jgi:hypothetical protein